MPQADNLTHHHILLYKGDFIRLCQLHGDRYQGSAIVRALVRKHIEEIEARLAAQEKSTQQG
jgi:hypothetical protein